MEIKKINVKDLNKVFCILQATNRKLIREGMYHWKGFYTKDKIKTNFSKSAVFLVSDNKKLIGTFTLSKEKSELYKDKISRFYKNPKEKTIYLSALAVLPSNQKQGYGKRIMGIIEEKAKRAGFSSITFDVVSDYKKLNDFYKKLGYKIIGRINGKIRKGNIYTKRI